jgi:predicted DCC family thiol-disulfide oxidoreductase YuxK
MKRVVPARGSTQAAALAEHDVILFDGVCNLCNGWVRFVIRRDRGHHYRFAPLQSSVARRILAAAGVDPEALDSVVLVEGGRAYTRSDAALRILRRLGRGWPALALLRVVPRFVRDIVYDWIAAHRYRWFGRQAVCMVPTPELRARFLDE